VLVYVCEQMSLQGMKDDWCEEDGSAVVVVTQCNHLELIGRFPHAPQQHPCKCSAESFTDCVSKREFSLKVKAVCSS